MSEQIDDSANDGDEWPLPSPDIVRELEAPTVVWSEPEPPSSWPGAV